MSYQISAYTRGISSDYYSSAGIVKLPARRSLDDYSHYNPGIKDEGTKKKVEEHLKKKKRLMTRKAIQRMSKQERLELLALTD